MLAEIEDTTIISTALKYQANILLLNRHSNLNQIVSANPQHGIRDSNLQRHALK